LLYEPLPSLKEIQTDIAIKILGELRPSRYAKAYISGRSIKDHVRFHDKQSVVVTLDIENFFGSITFEMVNKLFLSFGYSALVSNLLAKLTCFNGSLPQGAPSSPSISNIILRPLDDFLSEYCKEKEIRYTRYADDLAFSGEEINIKEVENLVSGKLADIGPLWLNKAKTLEMKNTQRQVISGIIVNSKIQVPREKRDELRQAIYYIEKFGLEDHLRQINCNKANYLKHLLGVANYILFINPKDEKIRAIKGKLHSMITE
jgi:RNA-directed DNA polymerase